MLQMARMGRHLDDSDPCHHNLDGHAHVHHDSNYGGDIDNESGPRDLDANDVGVPNGEGQ